MLEKQQRRNSEMRTEGLISINKDLQSPGDHAKHHRSSKIGGGNLIGGGSQSAKDFNLNPKKQNKRGILSPNTLEGGKLPSNKIKVSD